jgi:hypothetical protein
LFDQEPSPTGDARLDRTDREIEGGRDLGVVQIADITHHDGSLELLRQAGQGGIDRDPVGDAVDLALCESIDGLADGPDVVLVVDDPELWPSLAFAQFVERSVGGDPVHPGAERRSAVKPVEVANNPDHRLLGRIVGISRTSGDPTTDGVDPVVVPTQQLIHRSGIPALSGCDELAIGPVESGHG